MKKRKVSGRSQTFYIRSDLANLVERIADESEDMNKSDVVNMVLENAHLEELLIKDGDKTLS